MSLYRGKQRFATNHFQCSILYINYIDVFLALLAVIYEGIRLRQGPIISTSYHLHTGVGSTISHEFHIAIHMIQVMLKYLKFWYYWCLLDYNRHSSLILA